MRKKIRNILATLYFKIGVIVILSMVFTVMMFLFANFEYKAKHETWINVTHNYKHTVKKDNAMNLVLPLAIGIGIITGLFVVLFKKKTFDFDESYVSMKEASKRRKKIFVISIFLGYLGIDRYCLGKIFTGIIKSLICLCCVISLAIMIDLKPKPAFSFEFMFPLYFIFLFLFWWIGDVIYITLGAAKEKGGIYLR